MPVRSKRLGLSALFIATLGLAVGCGGSSEGRKPTFPVSGRVFYQDKPLAGVDVVFEPATPAPPGSADRSQPVPSGKTGADGRYQLSTYEADDGAPAGEYRVKLSTQSPPSADSEGGILAKREKVPDVLKTHYLDPSKTGLKATVDTKPTEVPEFRLK